MLQDHCSSLSREVSVKCNDLKQMKIRLLVNMAYKNVCIPAYSND